MTCRLLKNVSVYMPVSGMLVLGLGLALRTINNGLGLGLIGQVLGLGLGLASPGLGTTSQEEPWSLWTADKYQHCQSTVATVGTTLTRSTGRILIQICRH